MDRQTPPRNPWQHEEQDARRAVARWVTDPLVREIVANQRPTVRALVDRLDRQMEAAQRYSLPFIAGVFGCAIAYADDSVMDPFSLCPPSGIEDEARIALATTLVGIALVLRERGVALDPEALLDVSALFQLSVQEVDWSVPGRQLVETLDLPAPSGITGDGRGSVHRDQDRDLTDHEAIRRLIRKSQPDYLDLTDRGGRPPGRRTIGGDPAALSEALPALLAECGTSFTAGRLIRDWDGNIRGSPGVRLRELMGRAIGSPPPTESALRTALRAAVESGRKPSEGFSV